MRILVDYDGGRDALEHGPFRTIAVAYDDTQEAKGALAPVLVVPRP